MCEVICIALFSPDVFDPINTEVLIPYSGSYIYLALDDCLMAHALNFI